MKKMPCLFEREFHGNGSFTIIDKITPGCEWVVEPDVRWTRKWDGTACMVKDGVLFKRYDAKKDRRTGDYKPPPLGAIPCDEPDAVTGHWPHWVPVGDGPEDKWHKTALVEHLVDGSYELCGPAINGNHEKMLAHLLMKHGDYEVGEPIDRTLTLENFKEILGRLPWEGIVFHHPDGRMCKIRRNDLGLPWPV